MTAEPKQDQFDMQTRKEISPENLKLPDYVEGLRPISVGGMGAVYEARHKITHQKLAVKVLLPAHIDDETSRKRFMQEAQTITSLDDPNIVASYDYGVSGERSAPYMVMEFIDGTTLSQRIRSDGPLSVDEAIDVFLQVSSGLAHAHASGVIHRDIKPSNIMLASTKSGAPLVKLVDFGMAKYYRDQKAMQEALTISGNIVGTPLFMSPEQCMANPVDHRSDIYSLGCVMYLALTGKLAIDGTTVVEMFSKHVNSPIDMTPLPEPIKAVVARCLEKQPQDRYQTIEELREDLLRLKKSGRPKFHLTGKQRYSLKKSVIFIACIVLGFTFGYIIMLWSQAFSAK